LKLLLTDGAHPLSAALGRELERELFDLLTPAAAELDWCNQETVAAYMQKHKPIVVINTLGWPDASGQDVCDLLPRAAAILAQVCHLQQIPMIQLSSYRVFGANNKNKHAERDEPQPSSVEGHAFYAAEQAVTAQLERAIVLRSSWVIGSYEDNHLTRLLSALEAGQSWQLNSRLRGAPTALSDIARVIVALVKQISCGAQCWGVYHYCSGDACTEVEFAEQLVQVLQQQDYQGPEPKLVLLDEKRAGEPLSAALATLRIRNDFGVQARSWRSSLVALTKQWLTARGSNTVKS